MPYGVYRGSYLVDFEFKDLSMVYRALRDRGLLKEIKGNIKVKISLFRPYHKWYCITYISDKGTLFSDLEFTKDTPSLTLTGDPRSRI